MGEANRRDYLLDLGVSGIFVELGILDIGAKIGRSEVVGVISKQDVRGEKFSCKFYSVVLTDPPIVLGRED